jgi:hypothetical protein
MVIAVFFKRDIDDHALSVLAPVEHLEPVRVVDPSLWRLRAATADRGRWGCDGSPGRLRAGAKKKHAYCHGRQRRKVGIQLNRDTANGPGPDTIT